MARSLELPADCSLSGACRVQLLLRKGGIREQGFEVKAHEFALMPTSFHIDKMLLAPDSHAAFAEVRGIPATAHWRSHILPFPKLDTQRRIWLCAPN